MRKRDSLKPALLVLALLAAVFTAACLNAEGVAPPPGSLPENRSDRTDCQAINGTAFRSSAERDWYNANCSAWPPLPVDPGPPRTEAPKAAPLPPECIAMRGKPYTSADQRNWYLANCNGQAQPGQPPPGQPQQGGNDGAQASSGNRENCDQIRGTPYQSPAEREWFLKNCPSQPQDGQQQAEAGPTRTNCDEIRGTAYRSSSERAWYLANCPSAPQQDQQPRLSPQQERQLEEFLERQQDNRRNNNDDRNDRGRDRDRDRDNDDDDDD